MRRDRHKGEQRTLLVHQREKVDALKRQRDLEMRALWERWQDRIRQARTA